MAHDVWFYLVTFAQQNAYETPEPLRPLLEAAGGELTVDPICLVSADVGGDIIAVSREHQADLVLLGWHEPVAPSGALSEPVQKVLTRSSTDVAVYLARHFRPIRRVLLPFTGSPHDQAALKLARRLSLHGGIKVTILHAKPSPCDESMPLIDRPPFIEGFPPNRVHLKAAELEDHIDATVRHAWMGYDMIITGASEKAGQEPTLFSSWHERLAFATSASLLVVQGRRSATPEQTATTPPFANAAA